MATQTTKIDAILEATSTKMRKGTLPVKETEVYDDLPGWVWGEMYWPSDFSRNEDASIPTLLDPDVSKTSDLIWQSGIGDGEDVRLKRIMKDPFLRTWNPKVMTGHYFVHRDGFYFYSDESVMETLTAAKDGDGRSFIDLWFRPQVGTPVTAAYLKYNANKDILFDTEFRQTSKFTGHRAKGKELDTDLDAGHVDKSKDEFKLTHDLENIVLNETLSATVDANLVASFVLGSAPLSVYNLTLTRTDIFKTELSFNDWIQRYQDFLANPQGANPLQAGEYYIGYKDSNAPQGVIQVLLPKTYGDYGQISYTKNYPSRVTFNKDVVVTKTDVEIGRTQGIQKEEILLTQFPALDLSSPGILDVDNFTLKVDEGAGDVVWTRVSVLPANDEGNTYLLDPDYGRVTLGRTTIPDSTVKATWKVVPLIEYEPSGSSKCYTERTLDLDPVMNSLSRGFIYLSNKILRLHHIHLLAPGHAVNASTSNYGPVKGGVELIRLLAKLHDSDHDPIAGTEVLFENHEENAGNFISASARSNELGEAYAQFLARGDVAAFQSNVELYESVADPAAQNLPADDAAMVSIAGKVINENPGAGYNWNGDAGPWVDNALLVPDILKGSVSNTYVFVVENDDPANPYMNQLRVGGRASILAFKNTGSWHVLKPIKMTVDGETTKVIFDRELRTKDTTPVIHTERLVKPTQVAGNPGFETMQFRVISDRILTFTAKSVDPPVVTSNEVKFDIQLKNQLLGEWTLPTPTNTDGSGLGGAVWMFLNSEMYLDNLFDASGPVAGGNVVRVVGGAMPTAAELKPNMWLVTPAAKKVLISRDDITQVNSSTMTVVMPPAPEGAGVYELVVGWRRPPVPADPGPERDAVLAMPVTYRNYTYE